MISPYPIQSQSARPDFVYAVIVVLVATGFGTYLGYDLITNPNYEWDNVLFLMLCRRSNTVKSQKT